MVKVCRLSWQILQLNTDSMVMQLPFFNPEWVSGKNSGREESLPE
jgi:hypothetical protein